MPRFSLIPLSFVTAMAFAACAGPGVPRGGGTGDDAAMMPAPSEDAGSPTVPTQTDGPPGPATTLVVDLGSALATMDGFGAADVWEAPITDAQADLFFDPQKGIGLSLLRMGIDQNGSTLSNWTTAKKAIARGAAVWAAPWSPPPACKDNMTLDNGGHLTADCYDSWATTIVGFAASFKAGTGADLMGLSPQNEPDFTASYASCLYSSAQMVAFLKVLGPKVKALSPPVKLIAPEPDSWHQMWTGQGYGKAILADPTTAGMVDVLATHQYGNGAVTAPPAGVATPIWETEVSGVMGSQDAGPSADIDNGLVVAKWVHDAITIGNATAWHAWWLVSLNNDNEGLLLKGGGITKRVYTVGNFSKFVRPGWTRVATSNALPAGVLVTAYRDPTSGAVAIVAINQNGADSPLAATIQGGGGAAGAVVPWVTSAELDLAAQPAIAVGADGTFAATLYGKSVTTFVSAAAAAP